MGCLMFNTVTSLDSNLVSQCSFWQPETSENHERTLISNERSQLSTKQTPWNSFRISLLMHFTVFIHNSRSCPKKMYTFED